MYAIIRNFLKAAGIFGALIAAEGTSRLAGFVGSLGGGDAAFYYAILLISVLAAGIILSSFWKDPSSLVKWLTTGALTFSFSILLIAPAFGATQQAAFGLALATLGTIVLRTKSRDQENSNRGVG